MTSDIYYSEKRVQLPFFLEFVEISSRTKRHQGETNLGGPTSFKQDHLMESSCTEYLIHFLYLPNNLGGDEFSDRPIHEYQNRRLTTRSTKTYTSSSTAPAVARNRGTWTSTKSICTFDSSEARTRGKVMGAFRSWGVSFPPSNGQYFLLLTMAL